MQSGDPQARRGVFRTMVGTGVEVGPSAWAAIGGQPSIAWQPLNCYKPDPEADTDLKTQGSRSDW